MVATDEELKALVVTRLGLIDEAEFEKIRSWRRACGSPSIGPAERASSDQLPPEGGSP